MKPDEGKIVLDCQKGNWSEFGEIYDSYIREIYKFIYFKTMHKETAEDLTSQTFLKVVEKISGFDANTNLSAWIYAIARNTVIDFYRAQKGDLNIEDVWGLEFGESIVDSLVKKQALESVWLYLKNLDQGHREVILMRVWGGMSFKEIAGALGKSEGSVKMEFARSIGKIRQDILLDLLLLASLFDFNNLK